MSKAERVRYLLTHMNIESLNFRDEINEILRIVEGLEYEITILKQTISDGMKAHNHDRARADTLWRERDAARGELAKHEWCGEGYEDFHDDTCGQCGAEHSKWKNEPHKPDCTWLAAMGKS